MDGWRFRLMLNRDAFNAILLDRPERSELASDCVRQKTRVLTLR